MGDSFFKVFFICCFVILVLAGGILFMQMEQQSEDRRAVKAFVDSHGKTPVPPSWRGKIGQGI